jgi:hypothetical protein
VEDKRYPDAGHDPIASYDSPFMGDFVMLGTLSATAIPAYSELSATPAGVFVGQTALNAVASPLSGIALHAQGNVLIEGTLSATNVDFVGPSVMVEDSGAITNNKFLVINVNGTPYGLRLWDLSI